MMALPFPRLDHWAAIQPPWVQSGVQDFIAIAAVHESLTIAFNVCKVMKVDDAWLAAAAPKLHSS